MAWRGLESWTESQTLLPAKKNKMILSAARKGWNMKLWWLCAINVDSVGFRHFCLEKISSSVKNQCLYLVDNWVKVSCSYFLRCLCEHIKRNVNMKAACSGWHFDFLYAQDKYGNLNKRLQIWLLRKNCYICNHTDDDYRSESQTHCFNNNVTHVV